MTKVELELMNYLQGRLSYQVVENKKLIAEIYELKIKITKLERGIVNE